MYLVPPLFLQSLLAIAARKKRDPEIWHASVREFCRSQTKWLLASEPASPVLPRFKKEPVLDIVAPQPRRPVPDTAYSHRAGMGPDYGIEFYSPTREHELPTLPQPVQTAQRARTAVMAPAAVPPPSLYPIHIQSSAQPQRRAPAASSSPPPLGNWPRADAVNQPVRKNSKRKPVPPAGLDAEPPVHASPVDAQKPTVANPPRPRRKRTTSGEIQRPPPLDLSKISSF
ncbi:hypothetical protein HWV62_40192 [Athelia sp. TMB]|nr:hypothetical protein HWV62_40192 [Athelia sp. TMB]